MIYVALMLAGKSTRMHLDVPKQYLKIKEKYIFEYALDTFDSIEEISRIALVIDKDYKNFIDEFLNFKKHNHPIDIVLGDETRQLSVYRALEHFYNLKKVNEDDKILIHDACRPLVSKQIINEVCLGLDTSFAITPAIKIVDSLCKSDKGNYIDKSISREGLFEIQTPQGFKLDFIFKAHNDAINLKLKNFTDDTSLAIIKGVQVGIIEGSRFNFKITTLDDLD